MSGHLYISSPNVVTWSGFKDSETDTEVNDATLTMSLFNQTTKSPIAAGPAVDKGGGKVGIPCTAHGQVEDDYIRMEGSQSYNDEFAVHADTTANEIVIVATFIAESFLGTEKIYIGVINGCNISLPYTDSPGVYRGILPHTLGRLVEYAANQEYGGLTTTGLYYLFVKAAKDTHKQSKRIALQAVYDS